MNTIYIWCDSDGEWWMRHVSGYTERGPSCYLHLEWTEFGDYAHAGRFVMVRGALRRGECAVLIGPSPPSLE